MGPYRYPPYEERFAAVERLDINLVNLFLQQGSRL
jgi:hypothetical protein